MCSLKVEVKRKQKTYSVEELLHLSKNELIDRIRQLEAHNKQLKGILSKHIHSDKVQENESRKRKRPFDFTRFPKQHIALKLLYMGWDYQGFATIEDSISTIEHHLFAALLKSCIIENREMSNYYRCGRTDKAVSAFDQVITLTVRAAKDGQPPLQYCKILNSLLPKDIRVIAWKPVAETFSARFDCKRRTYRYFFPRGDLDLEAMEKGANYLLGTHDFRNLCKMDVAGGVVAFERTIDSIGIRVLTTSSLNIPGLDMCEFSISSKGFLWHQVRCIMGVLVVIGQKLEDPEVVKQLLDISKVPCKPQYSMAIGEPLSLFRCEFELEGEWLVDEQSFNEVVRTLHQQWAMHSIKETMIGQMLINLNVLSEGQEITQQSSFLLQGNKSKIYTPLMKKPTCESLETRIAHYVEKKKLEVKMDETEATG